MKECSEINSKKGIYLDIDMDYFVEPIELVSVDNVRLYKDRQCKLLPVAPVVSGLKSKGLTWESSDIHCFTNHKKSYTYWWISKKQNNTVIHIDAHSDLYRNSNKDLRLLPNGELGCYNYLWYAIRDGFVDEVYWVLPRSVNRFIDVDKANHIVNSQLIKGCSVDEEGLHVVFQCIDIYGAEKDIKLHICEIGMLPQFNQKCSKVTMATSPEFIPEAADCLVTELFEGFGADKEKIENIYRQHKDMLGIPEEEFEAAQNRIKKV